MNIDGYWWILTNIDEYSSIHFVAKMLSNATKMEAKSPKMDAKMEPLVGAFGGRGPIEDILGPKGVPVELQGDIFELQGHIFVPKWGPKTSQMGSKWLQNRSKNRSKFHVIFCLVFGPFWEAFWLQKKRQFWYFFKIFEEKSEICGHVIFDNPSTF